LRSTNASQTIHCKLFSLPALLAFPFLPIFSGDQRTKMYDSTGELTSLAICLFYSLMCVFIVHPLVGCKGKKVGILGGFDGNFALTNIVSIRNLGSTSSCNARTTRTSLHKQNVQQKVRFYMANLAQLSIFREGLCNDDPDLKSDRLL
jgi:hypothetical protein